MGKLKIISWNVNGLLSALSGDGFAEIKKLKPDVVCIQEIKTDTKPEIINGYCHFWNPSDRKNYSGTAVLTKKEPIAILNGFDSANDDEGRIILTELDGCYVVNVYVPNSQQNLRRRAFRVEWDKALYKYVERLMREKPVILCGDFNVVREEIDFFEENQRQHWKMQGYISDERSGLESLLDLRLVDVFRELNPDKREYSWWSNRLNKRSEDRGWRLDYFLISEELLDGVTEMRHLSEIYGSDHCPILLEVKL